MTTRSATVALPTPNLNGTSVPDLIAQHTTVLGRLNALRDALRDAFPHGRDYQLAPLTHDTAVTEAWAEMALLDEIEARHRAILAHLYGPA